jgi:prophage regulatory protein
MDQLQGFLRLKEVLKLVPLSKSTWWAGVKKGIYPQPVKLSARTTAWRVKDINVLINKLSGESDG